MIILGIETSCDETAAALIEVKGSKFKILSNIVSSQIKIHQKYGGVVPEVAARKHVENILPVIDLALTQAEIKPEKIDKIAVTVGPGLISSLLVGVETAKTLAFIWQKPIVPINHLKAHLYANWVENKVIKFPALALIVSGGHTELIYLKNKASLKKIGQTLDDAAGEAFDKVAKLLGLAYPGGPVVSKLAQQGNPQAFNFPRPMLNSNDFNFSFAGLKTAVRYTLQDLQTTNYPPDSPSRLVGRRAGKLQTNICASFQQAVVDVLVSKTVKAAKKYKARTIMLSGGVAANQLLRQTLQAEAEVNGFNFFKPPMYLCTDNAAMIAVAANFTKAIPWQKIKVDPNLEI